MSKYGLGFEPYCNPNESQNIKAAKNGIPLAQQQADVPQATSTVVQAQTGACDGDLAMCCYLPEPAVYAGT